MAAILDIVLVITETARMSIVYPG